MNKFNAIVWFQVALKIINKSVLSQSDIDKINREVKIMKVCVSYFNFH